MNSSILSRIGWLGITASVSTLAPVASAFAEEQRFQLDEIVVTARQRSEKLSDAPMSVVAFTESTIKRAHIKSVGDFVALTSNMGYSQTTNAGDTAVQIRGVIQPRDTEPPYALVIDGVVMPNPNSLNRQLVDIEQIEILKGPQGALYGRNAIAGAIIITTKKPTNELSGQVQVGYATGQEVNVSGSVSGAIVEEKLFFRVSGSILDRDGYYDNQTLQNKIDPYNEKTARARLIWDATENLTFDARVNYGKINGYAINFSIGGDILVPFLTPPYTDIFQLGGGVDVNNTDQDFFSNVQNYNIQVRKEAALKTDYSIKYGTFSLTAAFSTLTEPAAGDGPVNSTLFAAVNIGATELQLLPNNDQLGYSAGAFENPQLQVRNETDRTLDFRFTSNSDQSFRYVFGGYYADIDREIYLQTTQDVAGVVLPNPVNSSTSLSPTASLIWTDTKNKVKSVFGSASYDLIEGLEVTAALRWDSERKTNVLLTPNILTPATNDDPGLFLTPFLDNDPNRTRSRTFSKLQPKFSLRYKITPEDSVYATWGLATRSGGFNPFGTRATVLSVDRQLDTTVQDEYPSETSKSWEVGVKTSWFENRLSFNVAAFLTTVDNAHNFEFFPTSFSRTITLVDKVEIKGIEWDARARISEGLELNAAFGYTDAKVTENRNDPTTVGNRQAYTPEYTFNIGAQYSASISENYDIFARVNYQLTGPQWFNIANTPGTERNAVNLVDASIALESDNWTFTLYGKNIFDHRYNVDSVVLTSFFGNLSAVTRANPAIYGLDVKYNF